MTTGVVEFNYTTWAVRYPELAGSVTAPVAQLYFNEACLYCDNTPVSLVQDLTVRAMLLNMLTAHIAAMNSSINGSPSSPLVGRIESASEGSVNVTAKLEGDLPGRSWYAQTKYGLAYWQATAQYRTARYVPGPAYYPDPRSAFRGRRW
jgi:hypothetical protein